MFVTVPELIYEWNGGSVAYKVQEIVINLDKVSLIKEDKIRDRKCISIILDHNCIYLDMTLNEISMKFQ